MLSFNLRCGVNPREIWQTDVHHDYVGLESADGFQSLFSCARLSYDIYILLAINQHMQTEADDRMILYQQYSNGHFNPLSLGA